MWLNLHKIGNMFTWRSKEHIKIWEIHFSINKPSKNDDTNVPYDVQKKDLGMDNIG